MGTPIDLRAVEQVIDAELPDLARQVIRAYLDPSLPETQTFLDRPDDREQHQTSWHQWGIITHTRVFLRHFEHDIPRYLRQWNLWDEVDAVLRVPIDGVSRWELLRLSILFHDIGKFGARTLGRSRFHFANHEKLSGEIVRHEIDLARYGLTQAQVEYIATTAEDHFVLARLRKRAREQGAYHAGMTATADFDHLCLEIRNEYPSDFVEVGILFLGDSLAKVDPAKGPEMAASQHETNIAVSRRYLEVVLRRPPYNEPQTQRRRD